MRKAVIIMGPPGAGKGTQANLISDKYGLRHYDTGQRLRELIEAGSIPSDAYDSGKLIRSDWILQLIKGELRPIMENEGVILSGSPKTVLEAFGDDENQGLVDFLSESYGKDNVCVIVLNISEQEAIERDTKRNRRDDKPEVIHDRYQNQYIKRTLPTIETIKDNQFKVFEIDGMPSKEIVFEKIREIIDAEFN